MDDEDSTEEENDQDEGAIGGDEDDEETLSYTRAVAGSRAATAMELNVELTQTNVGLGMPIEGWVREHEGDKIGGGAAWKTYVTKPAGASRRMSVVDTVRGLVPAMHSVYAELVDSMEALLRLDAKWDMGTGGHLDSKKRPRLASSITTKRGGPLQGDVPADWGDRMTEWWLDLQPVERGVVQNVADLLEPRADMSWGTLHATRGYKGAFLLVWCMMYWAKSGLSMDAWTTVAGDMARVFAVLLTLRGEEEGGGGGDEEDRVRKKARVDTPAEDEGNRQRDRGTKKPGQFGWR
ncbi:unnamed protein product [Peniophora sp. CBMAI 1063]|nr:unnamed protein product [Peniophora sp. CBMAI 1063]